MISESSNQRTVEFYLSSLWSWLPEGRKRILEVLESCELVSASSTPQYQEATTVTQQRPRETILALLTQV